MQSEIGILNLNYYNGLVMLIIMKFYWCRIGIWKSYWPYRPCGSLEKQNALTTWCWNTAPPLSETWSRLLLTLVKLILPVPGWVRSKGRSVLFFLASTFWGKINAEVLNWGPYLFCGNKKLSVDNQKKFSKWESGWLLCFV